MMQEQQLQQLAQMLDADFNRKMEEKMRLRDEYGVYADDAAGLPSIDPFLALTAAGDAEAIGSGLSEIAGGDLFTGAGNVMLGAASLAIPGTLPKIKNVRGFEVTTRNPKTKGDLASLNMGETEVGRIHKIDAADMGVDGKPMFEPYIDDGVAELVEKKRRIESLNASQRNTVQEGELSRLNSEFSGQPQEIIDASAATIERSMALATREMLDAVPIGGKVGSSSLSTDSYGILLDKWKRGQLSARRFDEDFLNNPQVLNEMGRKYKNSPEVEAWHRNREDPTLIGFDETTGIPFDNTYAPLEQMDIDTFASVDPAAKAARKANNENRVDQLYSQYSTQSNNKYGLGDLAHMDSNVRLTREEAQSVADRFNMAIREAADGRTAQQERLLKGKGNKAKVLDDQGIPPAVVVENSHQFPGFYTVNYPQIPFHRNFEEGGKFKIKRKRPTGMQVKRGRLA